MLTASLVESFEPGRYERTVSVLHSDDGMIRNCWFALQAPKDLDCRLENHDFIVIALVFYAMLRGENIHIEGEVSARCLRNIDVFQDVWCQWRPEVYRKIRITADRIDKEATPENPYTAVCFSGGVDSAYCLYKHATRPESDLKSAVLMRGFDFPTSDSANGPFHRLEQKARSIAADLEIPLSTVTTNWKEDFCRNPHDEGAAGFVACLLQLGCSAHHLVCAADHDYSHQRSPYYSSPHTLLRLSGRFFESRLDSGEKSREEKIDTLRDWPAGLRKLQVCYEDQYRNCCNCRKCLQTQLGLWANGIDGSESLPEWPSWQRIFQLVFSGDLEYSFVRDILRYAKSRGVYGARARGLRLICIFGAIKQVPRDFMTWLKSSFALSL